MGKNLTSHREAHPCFPVQIHSKTNRGKAFENIGWLKGLPVLGKAMCDPRNLENDKVTIKEQLLGLPA